MSVGEANATADAARDRRPVLAVCLGLAGLLPFLFALVAAFAAPVFLQPIAFYAATIYGFIILSFLGGVHWGRALERRGAGSYLIAVIPALVAFLAAFLPRPWTLALLSAGFIVLGIYDAALFSRLGPRWYARLRIVLTVVVALALIVLSVLAVDLRVDPFGSIAP